MYLFVNNMADPDAEAAADDILPVQIERRFNKLSHNVWNNEKKNMSGITNYCCHVSFMKMSISCLLKSIVTIKYFESDFLEKL